MRAKRTVTSKKRPKIKESPALPGFFLYVLDEGLTRSTTSSGWRSIKTRRSFSIARFSIWRTRSFEMPRRVPKASSVALSSARRRSRKMRISRSDKTAIASCNQWMRRSVSMLSVTTSSGKGRLSTKNSTCSDMDESSPCDTGALSDTSGPERRASIVATSAFETPMACAMVA